MLKPAKDFSISREYTINESLTHGDVEEQLVLVGADLFAQSEPF